MYTISCCRIGKNPYIVNTKHKGIFKKNFKTLSEIAFFWKKCKKQIFFPNIESELTEKELKILQSKFYSVSHRIFGMRQHLIRKSTQVVEGSGLENQ